MLVSSSFGAIDKGSLQGKVLFYSNRDGDYEIFSVNANGSNVSQLTRNSAKDTFSRLSRNGGLVALNRGDTGVSVLLMNGDGTNERSILNLGSRCGLAFSPDGQKLIHRNYGGSIYARDDLFVYDLNSKKTSHLTADVGNEDCPDWSPQGKIAYSNFFSSAGIVGYLVEYQNICVINADGGGKKDLTKYDDWHIGYADWPKWSPDGTKIVYQCVDGGSGAFGIFVINADGSNKKRLTSGRNGGGDVRPVWSPDGQYILFSAPSADRHTGLVPHIMKADGTQVQEYMNAGDDCYVMDWIAGADNTPTPTSSPTPTRTPTATSTPTRTPAPMPTPTPDTGIPTPAPIPVDISASASLMFMPAGANPLAEYESDTDGITVRAEPGEGLLVLSPQSVQLSSPAGRVRLQATYHTTAATLHLALVAFDGVLASNRVIFTNPGGSHLTAGQESRIELSSISQTGQLVPGFQVYNGGDAPATIRLSQFSVVEDPGMESRFNSDTRVSLPVDGGFSSLDGWKNDILGVGANPPALDSERLSLTGRSSLSNAYTLLNLEAGTSVVECRIQRRGDASPDAAFALVVTDGSLLNSSCFIPGDTVPTDEWMKVSLSVSGRVPGSVYLILQAAGFDVLVDDIAMYRIP